MHSNEMNASDSFSEEEVKLAVKVAPNATKSRQELDKPIHADGFRCVDEELYAEIQ